MVWHEYLVGLATTPEGEPRLIPTGPPADPEILIAAETILKVHLPADLHALYGEMDGIDDPSVFWPLVMQAGELASVNTGLRNLDGALYATNFYDFVFFAGRGNGDLFGFRVVEGIAQAEQIVEWDHELDEIALVAHSLADFLRWWVKPIGS